MRCACRKTLVISTAVATVVQQRTSAPTMATGRSGAGGHTAVVRRARCPASQGCQRPSSTNGETKSCAYDAARPTILPSPVPVPQWRSGRETKRPGAGAVPTTHDVVGPRVHPSRTQRATTVTIRAHVITHTAAGCKRRKHTSSSNAGHVSCRQLLQRVYIIIVGGKRTSAISSPTIAWWTLKTVCTAQVPGQRAG